MGEKNNQAKEEPVFPHGTRFDHPLIIINGQIQDLTYNTMIGHCPNNTDPVFAGKLDGVVWRGMQWHLITKISSAVKIGSHYPAINTVVHYMDPGNKLTAALSSVVQMIHHP